MRLVVISGRSGSGKSTLLHTLEDIGFNAVDNFPVHLLRDFVTGYETGTGRSKLAISVDVRNTAKNLSNLPRVLESLKPGNIQRTLVFLDALNSTLVKRFSDTRRKHPLVNENTDLLEALDMESAMLAPISKIADLNVDTSNLSVRDLLDLAHNQIATPSKSGLVLILRSFGYKHGVPVDADFVFDVRCLPNPFWEESLRELSGLNNPVREFFDGNEDVETLLAHICQYLETWLPRFEAQYRIYVSVALGCTGGKHRSVYMVERIAERFRPEYPDLLVRHREI